MGRSYTGELSKASISIWFTALCICLPFWLKSEVKHRGLNDNDWKNKQTCEIEWDSHLTEETCKMLWSNYTGTEEYELCDFKYQIMEFQSDCKYEEFECVSLTKFRIKSLYKSRL